jgi:hypothetical protein
MPPSNMPPHKRDAKIRRNLYFLCYSVPQNIKYGSVSVSVEAGMFGAEVLLCMGGSEASFQFPIHKWGTVDCTMHVV